MASRTQCAECSGGAFKVAEQFEVPSRDVGTDLTTVISDGRRTVNEFHHSEEQRPALR